MGAGEGPGPRAPAARSVPGTEGFRDLAGDVGGFEEVKAGRGLDVLLVNSFRWGGRSQGGLLEEVTLGLRLGEPGSRPKEVRGKHSAGARTPPCTSFQRIPWDGQALYWARSILGFAAQGAKKGRHL